MDHGLRPGQLVSSRAGRDKGRPFLVIRVLDDRHVEVADGDLRSSAKPKRKNVRHLQAHRWVHEELAARLEQGEVPPDEELSRLLSELIAEATRSQSAEDG